MIGSSLIVAATLASQWLGSDKVAHVVSETAFTAISCRLAEEYLTSDPIKSAIYGGLAGALLGVGKEFLDSRQPGNYFDGKDLAADGLGIVMGISLQWKW